LQNHAELLGFAGNPKIAQKFDICL
jgi:hypothetical protein